MSDLLLSIGKLAECAGCKVETVHYYESIALMPKPPRSEGGHRIYAVGDVKRLKFIRRCRGLGFSLNAIRDLLKFIDEPDHYCGEIKAMAMLQAREVQTKIDDLQRLQKALNHMLGQCKGEAYTIDDCPIVNALYDNDDV